MLVQKSSPPNFPTQKVVGKPSINFSTEISPQNFPTQKVVKKPSQNFSTKIFSPNFPTQKVVGKPYKILVRKFPPQISPPKK